MAYAGGCGMCVEVYWGSFEKPTVPAAPGKFESKKLCSSERGTTRCVVVKDFHIFVVFYCGEHHDADSQTALSR
jgi:hypothetical protein